MSASPPRFVLGVVRAHRWSAGCSDSSSTNSIKDDVEFFLPTVEDEASEPPLVSKAELLACGRTLVASRGSAGPTSGSTAAISGGFLDEDDARCGVLESDDDEEEEIFNRDMDAVFRDLNLGHADDLRSPNQRKRHADESGIFFRLPASCDVKSLSVMGVAVPDPKYKRTYYVQQDVRFLVLFTNVPFHAYVRSKLADVAMEFFAQESALVSYESLSRLYRTLVHGESTNFAELPYRELFVGLPIVALAKQLAGSDLLTTLRAILLEGRVVCYSSNPSIASSAPLALLALLPGVLATTSSDLMSRTIQAVIYRLRRHGLPFSLFHEDFMLQPCFTSDQEREVYDTKGFFVGTSDPLLLKRPTARLDVIVNLDLHQLVTFPTKTTEHALVFGAGATSAFVGRIDERFGRNSSRTASSSSSSAASTPSSPSPSAPSSLFTKLKKKARIRKAATASLKPPPPERPIISHTTASMESAHSDLDYVLGAFQTYFECFLDEGSKILFDGTDQQDPYHPSIRALLDDLVAKPVFRGEHTSFYASYGRAWVHAWQTTNNYDNWIGAHRLEQRRRSSTLSSRTSSVANTPQPQDGSAEYMYPNGDTYDGMFQNGKRNGFGVYVEFVTKTQYEGEWQDDMRHGQGILSAKTHGYIYDGEWRHDMRCGRGHSSLHNVESYTGEWSDNRFHGVGVYTNSDGDVYDGEWRGGIKHGVGKLTCRPPAAKTKQHDDDDGVQHEYGGLTQYTGEWVNGKFHGTGTAQYVDGTTYSGGFSDGKRHGHGTLVCATSGDRYEGQWWKGYRHGEGILFSAKSGTTKEGTWRKDEEVDSDGSVWFIVYANGDKYTGACRRGRPWGDGVCKYANQSSYSGAWVDGLREGHGVCVHADGTILEGEWKNSVYVKPATRRPSTFVDIPLDVASAVERKKRLLSVFSQQHPESGTHVHVYPNGDTYDGEFANGMRHGKGVFTERATGNVYDGEWVFNTRQGNGILTSGMKDFIYDGAWHEDQRCGYGHCVIRGCETYSGQWKHNQFHGVGTYMDAEGHVYEGEFVGGKKHGVGKQVFSASGLTREQSYSGEWHDGYREGIGDAVFADGSTYSGSWRRDVREGEGTFVAGGSGDRYVGQWRNGMKNGAGILYVATTGVTKEGMWTQDEPLDGDWTIEFPDGSKFTGACVKSRPHGRGVCKYANGDLYDGQWVNGKRHGVGTGFFTNGESFVGEWENNHVALNGKGTLTLVDGTVHVHFLFYEHDVARVAVREARGAGVLHVRQRLRGAAARAAHARGAAPATAAAAGDHHQQPAVVVRAAAAPHGRDDRLQLEQHGVRAREQPATAAELAPLAALHDDRAQTAKASRRPPQGRGVHADPARRVLLGPRVLGHWRDRDGAPAMGRHEDDELPGHLLGTGTALKDNRAGFDVAIAHAIIWLIVVFYWVLELYAMYYQNKQFVTAAKIIWKVLAVACLLAIALSWLRFANRWRAQTRRNGALVLSKILAYAIAFFLFVSPNVIVDIAQGLNHKSDDVLVLTSAILALWPTANAVIYLTKQTLCLRFFQKHQERAADDVYSLQASRRLGGNGGVTGGGIDGLAGGGVGQQRLMSPTSNELKGLVIGDKIGEGIAVVYSGKWRGANVAVKMKSLMLDSSQQLEEFQHACNLEIQEEAEVMKGLCHPNIVLFMEAGFYKGSICIISEYCARGSLRDVLMRSNVKHLSWPTKLRLALGICHGIQYLHNAHPPMIHRDLKSPNVLVDDSWHAKIADFGTLRFSEIVSSAVQTSSVNKRSKNQTVMDMTGLVGTTRWMAPEVMRGEKTYTSKVDIYSLALILWELIEGKLPFEATRWNHEIEDFVLQGRRPQIQDELCPMRWRTLIMTCWQPDPKERPTIQQVITNLQRIAREEVWDTTGPRFTGVSSQFSVTQSSVASQLSFVSSTVSASYMDSPPSILGGSMLPGRGSSISSSLSSSYMLGGMGTTRGGRKTQWQRLSDTIEEHAQQYSSDTSGSSSNSPSSHSSRSSSSVDNRGYSSSITIIEPSSSLDDEVSFLGNLSNRGQRPHHKKSTNPTTSWQPPALLTDLQPQLSLSDLELGSSVLSREDLTHSTTIVESSPDGSFVVTI
ncbi:Tkl protein kinase, partial [Globisporangium splendens]